MERRDFLKQSALTVAAAASPKFSGAATPTNSIARRPLGKTGDHLSMIGFGGIVVMNEDTGHSKNIVAEAVDRGVNYFDVAPSYGDAEERLARPSRLIARIASSPARPKGARRMTRASNWRNRCGG